jgi:hypothetical protein
MSGLLARVERVIPGPSLGLVVEPLDVGLELALVDPPDAAAPDLDGGELARPDERVDLGDAHAQVGGDVLIVLMTSALVIAIWGVARDRLVAIVHSALSSVCGSIGC